MYIEHFLHRTYLVKSVLSAPVPAYCTEHASALSAQTKMNRASRVNILHLFTIRHDTLFNVRFMLS